MKKKVILTGSFGVGKTSIFNKFVYSKFDERYLTTIGVKVDKKTLKIEGEDVTLLVWDIAGEISQDKVPNSYFLQSSAVVYVFDLTRPSTYANMEFDLEYLGNKVPGAIVKIVGNKRDLVSDEELQNVMKSVSRMPDVITSAKTGENVEELFIDIAKSLIANAI